MTAAAVWRIGVQDGDTLTIHPDTFTHYRQAKRAAIHKNERRLLGTQWVVIAPSGTVANTGPTT